MKRFILVVSLFFVSGCAQAIHELKTDPAITGITGFWVHLGIEASPSTGGIPFPTLKFGHGTIWRVGVSDEVTIKAGEGFGSDTKEKAPGQSGQASLLIQTKNTSKALEKMKDLYSPDTLDGAVKTGK